MAEWAVPIVVAVISAIGSFVGVYTSNRKSQALMEYRLVQLEQKVDKHNGMIERMVKVEGRMTAAENEINDLKTRIA